MIFGIGTDILKVERIEQAWRRHGEHFAQRILMEQELVHFELAKNKTRYLAMRFAAKEAIAKAMGTGFSHGIWVRDVGTIANDWGQPQVIFSNRGKAVCNKLGVGDGFLSLTDEAGLVVAVAVLLRAAPPESTA
jgi:holo-[acyl-carrier protein] synthase